MMKVGITGGIGSGKSLICKALQALAVPVFFADDEVKKMYEDTPHVQIQLITVFGKEVFENQKLNRQRLAQLVFRSPKLLHQLNAIVHPALNQRFL
ncbi:MAG: dephospho-CoA kinase, partial [Bacteroidales bacterium]